MESDYQATLDLEAKKRYKEKLKLESEELTDPYALSENGWCDDKPIAIQLHKACMHGDGGREA